MVDRLRKLFDMYDQLAALRTDGTVVNEVALACLDNVRENLESAIIYEAGWTSSSGFGGWYGYVKTGEHKAYRTDKAIERIRSELS